METTMTPSTHKEHCPPLVDVIRETASQGAKIDNVEKVTQDISKTAEEIKKTVAKLDVKLALVIAGSVAGSAYGGRIISAVENVAAWAIDTAKVAVVWITEIITTSAYAGY